MVLKCSVIGCGPRKIENLKSWSLHRLPRGEFRRKKWLEAIGSENLKLHLKNVFICSLHFPESAFNYTLDVIRLRDDAVPLQLQRKVPVESTTTVPTQKVHDISRVPVPNPRVPVISDTKIPNQTVHDTTEVPVPSLRVPLISDTTIPNQTVHDTTEVPVPTLRVPVISTTTIPNQPVHDTTDVPVPSLRVPVISITKIPTQPVRDTTEAPVTSLRVPVLSITTIPTQPVRDTTAVPVPSLREQTKIKTLEQTCDSLRRKIRTLNQKMRRQKKKIAYCTNIIKNLQERNIMNNKSSIILEASGGPKYFLKRQILKKRRPDKSAPALGQTAGDVSYRVWARGSMYT